VPKLVWNSSPDGPKTYDIVLEELLWAEVRAMQKVTGASGLLEIGEQLEAADGGIIPALLWVYRKREEPTLTFKDLDDLKIRDVTMEATDAEKKAAKEAEQEAGPSPEETPQTLPPPAEPPPHGVDLPPPLSQPVRLAT
jgi:hypothetical protein